MWTLKNLLPLIIVIVFHIYYYVLDKKRYTDGLKLIKEERQFGIFLYLYFLFGVYCVLN